MDDGASNNAHECSRILFINLFLKLPDCMITNASHKRVDDKMQPYKFDSLCCSQLKRVTNYELVELLICESQQISALASFVR